MNRRTFFTLIGLGGIIAMGFLFSSIYKKRELKKIVKSTINHFKPTVNLPKEGKTISVETALNSRCTSDNDGNPQKFHWGMFDKKKKLSKEQIEKVISLAKIPQFTDQKIKIQLENNVLTFIIRQNLSGITKKWAMVESGMQQQAVGLVCSVLGIGIVFSNMGKNGTPISETDHGTIKIKLGAMKPTYNGSYWSSLPPNGVKPLLKGNLPEPARDGAQPLVSTLSNLTVENKGSSSANEKSISQLLWAARGRTPHLYKSKPWGMTIPTWAGKQHISSLYLVLNDKLYKYINWENDRATHAIYQLDILDDELLHEFNRLSSLNNGFIILGKNEDFARALWEVGYQLLNLMLQASSLNLSYQAILLNEAQKAAIGHLGVDDPVAIFAI